MKSQCMNSLLFSKNSHWQIHQSQVKRPRHLWSRLHRSQIRTMIGSHSVARTTYPYQESRRLLLMKRFLILILKERKNRLHSSKPLSISLDSLRGKNKGQCTHLHSNHRYPLHRQLILLIQQDCCRTLRMNLISNLKHLAHWYRSHLSVRAWATLTPCIQVHPSLLNLIKHRLWVSLEEVERWH